VRVAPTRWADIAGRANQVCYAATAIQGRKGDRYSRPLFSPPDPFLSLFSPGAVYACSRYFCGNLSKKRRVRSACVVDQASCSAVPVLNNSTIGGGSTDQLIDKFPQSGRRPS
jgi:hypothetical protein